MDGDGVDRHLLSEEEWAWACERLPISCVDVLPVQVDTDGDVYRVGLILRESPFGHPVWCHLGGRVLHGQTLIEAAGCHLNETLLIGSEVQLGREAYFVNEYLPQARPGFGHDPRKHAVAACFLAEVPVGVVPDIVPGEAMAFRWFARDNLPSDADLWPGTRSMIEHPGAQGAGRHISLTYEALSDRYISHNELMWQTPVLAMTAMAFLLTIALGGSEDWMRALAAGLSTVIAVISAQLMAKHSSSQLQDADNLYELEIRLGMLPIHRRPSEADTSVGSSRLQRAFASHKSRDWWFRALILFAVVSAVVCGLAVAAACGAI